MMTCSRVQLVLSLVFVSMGASPPSSAPQEPAAPQETQDELDPGVDADTTSASVSSLPELEVSPGDPTLHIRPAPAPVRIDGELDDAGWAGAARATGFLEFNPREDAEPPVRTEVLVTYDATNLYVGFLAHGDPAQVRASLRDRGRIWEDDVVGVLIDTYGDGASATFFLSNPLGVQADMLMTGSSEDDSYDTIFKTAGRLTETGYQVEMAIPFTSLRFPDRAVQSWRINFYRQLPRSSRHQLAWAPLSRDDPCLICQSGTLTGIEGVRPGGGLQLLPSVVAHQAGERGDMENPTSRFENGRLNGSASVSAKYAFRSGWTAEATYNPDFSQVESDAAQINVNTTFAISYPERRPFFQEGSELFDTWINTVHTRSINAPVVAGKATGRAGRTSIAYLGARDRSTPYIVPLEERSAVLEAGRSTSNIVRLRHNLAGDSHVGAIVTDRRLDGGGSGSTLGADARIRFGRVYRVQAQLVGSYTVEPDDPELTAELGDIEFGAGDERYTAAFDGESFAGRAAYLGLMRTGRFWSVDLNYRDVSPTYRADNGFQTRNDFRRASAWTGLAFYPEGRIVQQVRPSVRVQHGWNYDGIGKESSVSPGVNLTMAAQTQIGVNATAGSERFRDIEFDGIRRLSVFANSSFSEPVSLGINANIGRTIARNLATPALGDGLNFGAFATLRPTQRLATQLSYNYSRLRDRETGDAVFAGYILRTRFDFQLTRELAVRAIAQYNDFSGRVGIEPLIMYRLNPFSIFYLGSTHEYRDYDAAGITETRRQVFAKLQYLFGT